MKVRRRRRMGAASPGSTPIAERARAFLADVPFSSARIRAAQERAPIAVPARCRRRAARTMSTQEAFGRMLDDIGRRDDDARAPHRHDLARRHGLDQSRRLGQPPRHFRPRRARRRASREEKVVSAQRWAMAPAGPAYRARHRREQSVPAAGGAGPGGPAVRRAAAADRHALRSRSSSAASMRSITRSTRTRASCWWRRRRASRWRPRAARTSRSRRR